MTRAAWEFLKSDRPDLKLPEWQSMPLDLQALLANVDPEEIITKVSALRLADLNMTWDTFIRSLHWSKNWTFYPKLHEP